MDAWTTVTIPTRDSAAWIGTLLAHYEVRGVTPTILLDSRTRDGTEAIARSFGAPVVPVRNFSFTEAIVAVTRDCVTTPWALFMHDDEVPSDALFRRLHGKPPPDEAESVAIPRRWAWYEAGKTLAYGWSDQWQDRTGDHGRDYCWRLFRPGRVTFAAKMHSEGFLIDRWTRLPLDTYFVHFEWVIRSHAERVAKLRRYDEYRDGYGRFFEKVYLPESQPDGLISYMPFETDAYDRLAQAYYQARRPPGPLPRPSLRWRWATLRSALRERLAPTDFSEEPADRAGLNPRLDREVADRDP